MKREEAQKLIIDLLTGHHPECSQNHYKDVALGIDKIFDSFEKDGNDTQQIEILKQQLAEYKEIIEDYKYVIKEYKSNIELNKKNSEILRDFFIQMEKFKAGVL